MISDRRAEHTAADKRLQKQFHEAGKLEQRFSASGVAVRGPPTATVETCAYASSVIAVRLGTLIVGTVVLVVCRSPPAY